jgi:alpha-maltose-1-phosphate synthase
MKIAIATTGRFHVLDLARELDHLGARTSFYSYIPRGRAQRFGLPSHCHRGLLPIVAPFVGWQAYAPSFVPKLQEKAMTYAVNAAVVARSSPCDFFICMSGIYLEAAKFALRRYGAAIWLERASMHIEAQDEILRSTPGAQRPSRFMIERELEGYELADRIVIPSAHVARSFGDRNPSLVKKLFVNPYGVDLVQFPARESPPPGEPVTVLFVGGWTYQKGVDVLVRAIRQLRNVRLLHVGSLGDAPFPLGDSRFEHVDPVPQWRLHEYYAKAHVFALASRQEGFGMVLLQAAATGLPIVCTDRTGGSDLKLSRALSDRIYVTPAGNAEALANALSEAIDSVYQPGGLPPLPGTDRALLSWSVYGKRYHDELRRVWNAKRNDMDGHSARKFV